MSHSTGSHLMWVEVEATACAGVYILRIEDFVFILFIYKFRYETGHELNSCIGDFLLDLSDLIPSRTVEFRYAKGVILPPWRSRRLSSVNLNH